MKMNSQLLFIGGFPSGGTDLLKNILNAHPDIYINGEMPLLHKLLEKGYSYDSKIDNYNEFRKLINYIKRLDEWSNIENINLENISYPIDMYTIFYKLFSDRSPQIWGNKTPQNTENCQSLYSIFPSSKFIIITRDIRDICLSWGKKWSKNIFLCSEKWNKRMMLPKELMKSNTYCYIKYENLISDTEGTTKLICEFLNIAWSQRMLEYHKHTHKIIDGKINYGKKINTENMNKWKDKFSKKEIFDIESIAYNTMQNLGYLPEYAQSSKKISISKKIRGILSDLYSIIFIGNNFSNNNTLLNRISGFILELKKRMF